ncbi:MAG: hypothetical protein Q4C56_08875 [Peptococcaceae bacterium]|nr:hypothetical protein [Peptococcaceae bacterium]
MKKVADNLRALSAMGKTIFIVTHDPELIATCCNYFVFIDKGRILWSDGVNSLSRKRLSALFDFAGEGK